MTPCKYHQTTPAAGCYACENARLKEEFAAVTAERDRLREALENIRRHMAIVTPHGYEMSTVWFMADKALRPGSGEEVT